MVTDPAQRSSVAPIVFVLDCDNTLLQNDRVKSAMDTRLRNQVGTTLTDKFWRVYEDVRARKGTVDLPDTFADFRAALSSDAQLEQVRAAIMEFPFQEYLYPESLGVLAALKQHGLPVIVSDGDGVYQPHKIIRSGLAEAVDGAWVVYIHKEDHLDAVMDRWPAEFYVMIDDKARILAETKSRLPSRFITVHIQQGHYADDVASPAPDITLKSIGDVRNLDFETLARYLHW